MNNKIKYLLTINSFFIFAISLFAPFYAIYIQKISPSLFHIGGVWSFYTLSAGILVYFISKFENRLKYADYFLISGFMVRSLGWLGYIFATNIFQIYALQLLLALGEALGTPSYNFLYSVNLEKQKVASDWGLSASISLFIMTIASLVGSIVLENFGFKVLLIIMIILSFISTSLALKYRKQLSAKDLFNISFSQMDKLIKLNLFTNLEYKLSKKKKENGINL